MDQLIRKQTIDCPLKCGAAGLIIGADERVIIEHLTNHCPHRPLHCPHGYPGLFQAPRHLAEECERDLTECPNGCFEPAIDVAHGGLPPHLRSNDRFRPSPAQEAAHSHGRRRSSGRWAWRWR